MAMRAMILALLAAAFAISPARAKTIDIPFDFSRGAIGLDATVRGAPVYDLFDSGVSPSVIDLTRAQALDLPIDRQNGGAGSGVGDTEGPTAYPARIEGLAIGGEAFAPFDALATDMSGLSKRYGRAVDAVLGYSFIRTRVFLIDYARRRLVISDRAADAARVAQGCRARWVMPLRFLGDDNWPTISAFRLGDASGPATLDTGSNGEVTLYPAALDLPGVRAALTQKGEVTHSGFRGDETSRQYVLNAPIGFGPFALPAGQIVTLGKPMGDTDKRIANIGNGAFAAMKVKILLDYPAARITFFGSCSDA